MAIDSMAGFGASYDCMLKQLDDLILCTINRKRPETSYELSRQAKWMHT